MTRVAHGARIIVTTQHLGAVEESTWRRSLDDVNEIGRGAQATKGKSILKHAPSPSVEESMILPFIFSTVSFTI